jgi:hypothetical protein
LGVFFSLEWTWIGGIFRGIFKNWLDSSLQPVVDLDRGDFQGDFKNWLSSSLHR